MKTTTKTIITTLIIFLALIQGPYLYYYTSGLMKVLIMIPYYLTGLCLSIYLLQGIIRFKSSNNTYNIAGLIVASSIGLLTVRPNIIEYLDWKLRRNERNEIVEGIKNGSLKVSINHINGLYKISQTSIFPISTDGNEISIDRRPNGIFDIEFFTDRGFLDHYSSFLYTNNPIEMYSLDKSSKEGSVYYKKLDTNWYEVRN